MKTDVREYKGNPVLSLLTDDGKIIVTFGLRKAKAILEAEKAIVEFVAQSEAGVLKVPAGK